MTPRWATSASSSSRCSAARSATARLRPRVTVVRAVGRERGGAHGTIVADKWPARTGQFRDDFNRTLHDRTPSPSRLDRDRPGAARRPARRPGPGPDHGRHAGRPATGCRAAGRSRPTSACRAVGGRAGLRPARRRGLARGPAGLGDLRRRRRPHARRAAPPQRRSRDRPGDRCSGWTPAPRGSTRGTPPAWRRAWREVSAATPPRGLRRPARPARAARGARRPPGPHPRPRRRPRRGGRDRRAPPTGCGTCSTVLPPGPVALEDPGYRAAVETVLAASAARCATCPRSAPVTDLTGAVGGVRHPCPPAPARPGDVRRRPADPAGRRPRPPARSWSRTTTTPSSATTSRRCRRWPRLDRDRVAYLGTAEQVRAPEPAAGLAGPAGRPARRGQPNAARSPTTPRRGRCSGPSSSLLRDGYVDKVVRSARRVYAARAPRVAAALAPYGEIAGPVAGMYATVLMPADRAARRAHRAARSAAGFEVPLLADNCRSHGSAGWSWASAAAPTRSWTARWRCWSRPSPADQAGSAAEGGVRRGPLALDLAAQEVRRAPQQREDRAQDEHHRHHEAEPDRGRPGSPSRARRPTRARSIPASSRQATVSPSPTASAVPGGTSAMVIITGVVSPSVIASRRAPRRTCRGAASAGTATGASSLTAPLEHRAGLADGDDRAGDQHRAGAERVAERLARLGERRGLVDRVGEPGHRR